MPYLDHDVARRKSAERMRKMRSRRRDFGVSPESLELSIAFEFGRYLEVAGVEAAKALVLRMRADVEVARKVTPVTPKSRHRRGKPTSEPEQLDVEGYLAEHPGNFTNGENSGNFPDGENSGKSKRPPA